jgi:CRP-like cAMP-binding protein
MNSSVIQSKVKILQRPTASTFYSQFLRTFFLNDIEVLDVKKDHCLFEEGKPANQIYILESGLFKILKIGFDRPILVSIAYGDKILNSWDSRNNLITRGESLSPCRILKVPRLIFEEALQKHKEFQKHYTQSLMESLQYHQKRQALLSSLDAKKRMIHLLLDFSELLVAESLAPLPLALSRADYADLIGTTVETTVRILKSLCEDGFIAVRAKEITLLKPEGLRQCLR